MPIVSNACMCFNAYKYTSKGRRTLLNKILFQKKLIRTDVKTFLTYNNKIYNFTLQLIEYKSLWNNRKYILFTNTTMQIIHTQQSCTCTRFIRGTCLNWQIRYIFIKKKVVWPCSHLNHIEETLIPISGQTTNINLWVFFHRKYQIVITFAVYSLINIFSYHSLYIGTQTVEMYIFYKLWISRINKNSICNLNDNRSK